MIAVCFVEDALDCLRRQGLAVEPVLRAAGLPDPVRDPISIDDYGALWMAMAMASGDEMFGLGARPMRPGSFTLLCHCILHAGTLERALRRALRFLGVVLDQPRATLVVEGGLARVVLGDSPGPRAAFVYRAFWLTLHGVICWLVGRRIPLKSVDFTCGPPGHSADYRQFFGAPVRFDQPEGCLTFDAAFLALPAIRSERALRVFLRGAPANLLIRYRHDAGVTADIRAMLRRTPPSGWPDFDDLAMRLRIPPATLRRRLRAEGQSYQLIKDEIRRARAERLLRETGLSVADIATELGYSEPSAFQRAFRKWTMQNPATFRRSVQD